MKLKRLLRMMLFAPLAIFGIVGAGDAGTPADTVSTPNAAKGATWQI